MPDETTSSNPIPGRQTSAKRLLVLFDQIRNTSGPNLIVCLSKLFGFGTKTAPPGAWEAIQCQRIVGEMIENYQTELAGANLDDDEQILYGRCLLGITRALAPFNMALQKNEALGQVSPIDLNDLEHADRIFRKSVRESEISKNDLSTFVATIQQALTVLQSCDLPEHIKAFMIDQLLHLKQAVEQYQYRGVRGIEEALASYCGSLYMTRGEVATRLPKDEVQLFASILDKGQKLVNLANSAVSLWPQLTHGAESLGKVLGLL